MADRRRAWSVRVGAKGFLAKPVRKDLLLSTVGAVLARSWRAKARQLAEQGVGDTGAER